MTSFRQGGDVGANGLVPPCLLLGLVREHLVPPGTQILAIAPQSLTHPRLHGGGPIIGVSNLLGADVVAECPEPLVVEDLLNDGAVVVEDAGGSLQQVLEQAWRLDEVDAVRQGPDSEKSRASLGVPSPGKRAGESKLRNRRDIHL